jgi:uncharacterized protein with PIN domain
LEIIGLAMATIHVRFYAELGDFLPAKLRGREFAHPFPAGGAVKDLVEGLGVPHTEVDLILVNGTSVDLAHHLRDDDWVSVYPVFEALDISQVTRVRSEPLRLVLFAADVHLGKLAGYLRLAGFDTVYRNDWDDSDLIQTALREHRVIVTRDRELLKRAAVTHGYLVRETMPRAQLSEVLSRFDLWEALRPLSRCSVCNCLVGPVDADMVKGAVPLGTACSFKEFWRCTGCGKVYWKGAHYRSLESLLRRPQEE